MSEDRPGRPVSLLHLESQVWSEMRERLADIERIADHGPNGSPSDDLLVRQVFNVEGGIDAWSRQIDSSVPRY